MYHSMASDGSTATAFGTGYFRLTNMMRSRGIIESPNLSSWCSWGHAGHSTVSLFSLRLEQYLNVKLLAVFVEPRPEPAFSSIDFPRLQFEPTCLIRLCGDQKILVILVRWIIYLLLKGRHEPYFGYDAGCDFRILQLEEQAVLPRQRIPRFGDLVSRPANLDHVSPHLHTHVDTQHILILGSAFLLLPRRSPCKIRLMFPALCMSEIGAIVLMDCEAETAFEGSDMIFEEIRVLVEIDCFKCELSKTFASIGICGRMRRYTTSTEFATCTVL